MKPVLRVSHRGVTEGLAGLVEVAVPHRAVLQGMGAFCCNQVEHGLQTRVAARRVFFWVWSHLQRQRVFGCFA